MERNTLQDITLLQHCRCKKLSRHRLIGHCLSSKVWVGTNNHKDNETAMICNNCSAPIPATAVFYRNPLSITAQRKSINTMRPAFRSHGIIHRKTVVVTGNQCWVQLAFMRNWCSLRSWITSTADELCGRIHVQRLYRMGKGPAQSFWQTRMLRPSAFCVHVCRPDSSRRLWPFCGPCP